MADATSAVSPLRRRMIEDMTLCNLSPATQRSYLHAITKFSRYFGRSPDRLGLEDVRAFQVYLVSQGISWPALNQTVCALRFFYGVTLDRAEIPERIAYARTPHKLPTILSADEVVRFLEAVPSLKARAALTTAYAAVLRASETVSLKVADSLRADRPVVPVPAAATADPTQDRPVVARFRRRYRHRQHPGCCHSPPYPSARRTPTACPSTTIPIAPNPPAASFNAASMRSRNAPELNRSTTRPHRTLQIPKSAVE